MANGNGATVFFYELHEGDDDLFADLILAREEEMPPDLFYEVVQEARRRVQESFEQDTLIEAIAEELEREHGFIFISDDRLTAAVNVSTDESENYLARIDPDQDEIEDDEDETSADFRTLVADLDPPGSAN